MQKQTGVCFFLCGLQLRHFHPFICCHLEACFFAGYINTLPCCISLYRCSFHSPTKNLMMLVLLNELLRNFLHCCMLCPFAKHVYWRVLLAHRFSLSESLMDGWRYTSRQHQPYHSVHPHTVPWTRQTVPVVQMFCCCRSFFVPDPSHQ